MDKLAIFRGVSTPVSDLARAIQDQGWQLGIVKYDNKLGAYTAEVISPHGEKLSKTGPDEATAVANSLLAITRRNHMRTTAQFKVGMWRTNWHERQREIAEAYRDAPIYDPKAVAAYKSLGDDSTHRLHVLSGQLHIEPTNEPHPYQSADDMRKDVHEKRHYYLTKAGSAHPVWTSDQVAAFRAVHDILGHGVAGGHYDWPGRVLAAHAHAPLLEPIAQQALFSEAVARPAFLQTYGAGPQKMALFPDFVEHHQDSNNPSAHQGIHPSQTTAPVASAEGFATLANINDFTHYHLAPQSARDSILQHGLNWDKGGGITDQSDDQEPGNFIFPYDKANPYRDEEWYAEEIRRLHEQPHDVWHVDARGLPLKTDLVGAHYSVDPIPPRRLQLRTHSRTASWGNTVDVNKGFESGVDPLPVNAYAHHGDPLQRKATMDNAKLIDTGWAKFQKGDGSDDRERMKLAIVNAFRVVLLSPRKILRWNAIHYQDISNIPGGVDDPKVYWDTLEKARRDWNTKLGYAPDSHMIFFKYLKPFEARIAANHPEKGWEWAKAESKQTLFNWWTEEQERIQAEDSKRPADKQRDAGEIERRANEALARRMQLFLKAKDDKADVEDGQLSMLGWTKTAVDDNQQNILAEAPGKYGAFMGTHLKAISQVSQHSDEILNAAIQDVRAHDGEGHHFRQKVLQLGVSGVGPKVCSFAWLMLQPMTSQLATIDTHMMDVLGHDYDKDMNNRDYFKFERQFRTGLDAAGYSHLPLGVGQWGMWDYKRTGPGSHQDHSAMRVLDPKPHPEVDWVDKAVNLKGESWHNQAPDWWQNTKPARDAVGDEWDQTYGKTFNQNQIPYQDLGTSVTAKKNPDEFHVSWGVPDDVLDKLHGWAKEQGLGKVEDRDDLHMTALYLPEGHSDQKYHDWIANQGSPSAEFHSPSIDFFPSQEEKGGTAIVVTFAGDEGKATSERLIDEAEGKGAEVKHFPGGYSPHITVGYADEEPEERPTPPDVSFTASGLTVSKPRHTAAVKEAYADPFSHYWDRSMPVGYSLESKAKTLAEYAKADKLTDDEYEDWLNDHKSDTKLTDAEFKRFKKKSLRKFERLSHAAGAAIDAGRTPSFTHPGTMEVHQGMPGQSLMEHARLQTGLSTQDVWRLLADEHVHKA